MRSESSDTALDLGEAFLYCGGNADLVRRMLTKFAGLVPSRIQELDQATAANDLEEIQRIAHSVKGTAAPLGAKALRRAAAALETACREQDAVSARELVAAICREADRFCAAVAQRDTVAEA